MKNKRHHQIPSEALDILLALRVKDVNLDREEQEEVTLLRISFIRVC